MRDFTSLEAGLSLMPGLPPDEVARLLDDRSVKLRSEIRALDAELVSNKPAAGQHGRGADEHEADDRRGDDECGHRQ